MTLVYLTLAWIAGIVLAHLLRAASVAGCDTPRWPFAVAATAAAAALALAWRDDRRRLIAALALLATLGAWRYQAAPVLACLGPADLASTHAGQAELPDATVVGVVIRYPELRDGGTAYRLRAEEVTVAGETRAVQGGLLVHGPAFPPYRYGDRLRVTGVLQDAPVFADFDYRAYLARQGIRSVMWRADIEKVGQGTTPALLKALYEVRERGSELLNRLLPEPAAALANGMLLGIEGGIPPAVSDAFRAVGATHVIVISGSNVALLAGTLLAVLGRLLGRRRAALPVVAAIALYVLLIGAEPAALRAGIMGILWVLAIALGRRSTAWVSLGASALVMTLADPLALWDVGFQISFAATLGLILFSGLLAAWLGRLWKGRAGSLTGIGALSDGLAATIAAQALVIPVVMFHFGQFSPVSPVVNALIAPAQPPILAGGMATLLLGLAWEPLGRILAAVPWLFLTYTTAIVEAAARAPFATLELGAWGQSGALLYAIVAAGAIGASRWVRVKRPALQARSTLKLAAVAVLPAWAGLAALSGAPDGRLHITFLPQRGVEAALITTPTGTSVLVWSGGAEDGARLSAGTGPIDLWVGEGLPDTGQVRHIEPCDLQPGGRLGIRDGVTLERIGAGASWGLLLRYGHFVTLLPSLPDGTTQTALAEMPNGPLREVTVLKLPGPETGRWPTPELLAGTHAQLLLWPEGTTYPPGVAETLRERAVRLTPDTRLEITTDGARVWLRQSAGPAIGY